MSFQERINGLCSVGAEKVNTIALTDELSEPKALGIDADVHLELLKLSGAIRSVQGTRRVYLEESLANGKALERIGRIREALTIVTQVLVDRGGSLSKEEVVEQLGSVGLSEEDYYGVVSLLSYLEIASSAGRSRTGGIVLFQQVDEQDISIEDSGDEAQEEKVHEKTLYDPALKVLSRIGYEAVILGVRRRFSGEWSTPDVMGYRVVPFKVLGGSHLEVVTIEVKLKASKLAVAEVLSHKKYANRAYLMVDQTLEQIDEEVILQLTGAGIGLICRKEDRSFEIVFPSTHDHPDPVVVDEFLEVVLSKDHQRKEKIRESMAKSLRQFMV